MSKRRGALNPRKELLVAVALAATGAPSLSSVTWSQPAKQVAVVGEVQVVGGKLLALQLLARGAQSSGTTAFAAAPGKGEVRLSVPSHPSISVHGIAHVEDDAGEVSQRALGVQHIATTGAAAAAVSWTVDLSEATVVHAVIGPNLPAAQRGRTCSYEGRGAAAGIFGSRTISATETECLLSLSPPALYVMQVLSHLSSPAQQSVNTPLHHVVVNGGTHTEVFNEAHGLVLLRAELDGMIEPSVQVHWVGQMTRSSEGNIYSHSHHLISGSFLHVLPYGPWRTWIINPNLSDFSNPDLPLSSSLLFYNYNDPAFLPAEVTSSVPMDLGLFSRTLGRARVFFDVVESPGAPESQLRNPQVQISQWVHGASGAAVRRTYLTASGSNAPRSVSGLRAMAPPGEYTLLARAEVNGALQTFASSTIRFGQVIRTAAEHSGQSLLLTPDTPELPLTLRFPSISGAGNSAVVSMPLGPEPPSGLSLACEASGAGACPPLYYDLSTTAQYTGSVELCLQRRLRGPNALAESLRLLRYDPAETACDPALDSDPTTPGCWADVTTSVLDCSDPTHSAACGCTSEGCGSDPDAEQPLSVFKVCGSSGRFSVFAVMHDW